MEDQKFGNQNPELSHVPALLGGILAKLTLGFLLSRSEVPEMLLNAAQTEWSAALSRRVVSEGVKRRKCQRRRRRRGQRRSGYTVVKVDDATPKRWISKGAMINQYLGVAPSTFQLVYWKCKVRVMIPFFLIWWVNPATPQVSKNPPVFQDTLASLALPQWEAQRTANLYRNKRKQKMRTQKWPRTPAEAA